ncbi:hypothetical protein SLE2022_059620 [Rubroshorea leprosula]
MKLHIYGLDFIFPKTSALSHPSIFFSLRSRLPGRRKMLQGPGRLSVASFIVLLLLSLTSTLLFPLRTLVVALKVSRHSQRSLGCKTVARGRRAEPEFWFWAIIFCGF